MDLRADPGDVDIIDIAPPAGWVTVFQKAYDEIALVSDVLKRHGAYFPPRRYLYRAFDLCPLDSVRVVILGQDPYHSVHNNVPQANGMAFSTNMGCPVQPSLANIFRELKREYGDGFTIPQHGDLSRWAMQGVLLMNTCLTVSPHKAGSHKDVWMGLISRVIDELNRVNPSCIYMLWGKKAHAVGKMLGGQAVQLLSSHPSPFSAHRGSRSVPAFMGCNHFRMANETLVEMGKTPIDWQI